MESWKRFLKREKEKNKQNKSYRNFGSLTDNSVVTDIYYKKIKKRSK